MWCVSEGLCWSVLCIRVRARAHVQSPPVRPRMWTVAWSSAVSAIKHSHRPRCALWPPKSHRAQWDGKSTGHSRSEGWTMCFHPPAGLSARNMRRRNTNIYGWVSLIALQGQRLLVLTDNCILCFFGRMFVPHVQNGYQPTTNIFLTIIITIGEAQCACIWQTVVCSYI